MVMMDVGGGRGRSFVQSWVIYAKWLGRVMDRTCHLEDVITAITALSTLSRVRATQQSHHTFITTKSWISILPETSKRLLDSSSVPSHFERYSWTLMMAEPAYSIVTRLPD